MNSRNFNGDADLFEMIKNFFRLVRFSHTVFAMPFALTSYILAVREKGIVDWLVLLWVVLAMVTARNAAMGFNRIVDYRFDKDNPRTAQRELPQGKMSLFSASVFVAVNSALFILITIMINQICGWLSPLALGILFFYSLTKRFTWTSQFFLGLSLSLAPIGAWLAVTGGFDWRIFILSGAVLAWVAGFDIYYACLDIDFDKRTGLHSIPQRWGVKASLWIARMLHLITVILLLWIHWLFNLNWFYLLGMSVVTVLIVVEDIMVRADDLSKASLAFDLNTAVGALYFLGILGSFLI